MQWLPPLMRMPVLPSPVAGRNEMFRIVTWLARTWKTGAAASGLALESPPTDVTSSAPSSPMTVTGLSRCSRSPIPVRAGHEQYDPVGSRIRDRICERVHGTTRHLDHLAALADGHETVGRRHGLLFHRIDFGAVDVRHLCDRYWPARPSVVDGARGTSREQPKTKIANSANAAGRTLDMVLSPVARRPVSPAAGPVSRRTVIRGRGVPGQRLPARGGTREEPGSRSLLVAGPGRSHRSRFACGPALRDGPKPARPRF